MELFHFDIIDHEVWVVGILSYLDHDLGSPKRGLPDDPASAIAGINDQLKYP
jgi:hypothetical protein